MLDDLRYAWRTLRRTPGFAAIAIGSTALGVGACSIIVAIITAALFPRLPVEDPSRLLSISEQNLRSGEGWNQLSYPDLLDVRRARTLEAVAGADSVIPASIGVSGADSQRLWGALVTANYFAVVRPRFALGRGFDPDRDDRAGEAAVVVLSHRLWQTHFNGDANVIGRTLTINGNTATVIGVTDASFRGTELGLVPEFWIPFSAMSQAEPRRGPIAENRHRHWLEAVARLRPGVELPQARAELDVLAQAMNAADPEADKSRGFPIEPAGRLTPAVRGQATVLFALLFGVTLLILLAACANVANLLLGRASMRRREIAARLALGASRWQVVRHLLTESVLLALAGGIGGWLMAIAGAGWIGQLKVPMPLPVDLAFAPDWRVLLFAIALSLVTGVIFGLVPALRATRLDLVSDLKSDGRGTTVADRAAGRRLGLRNVLVVVQVAICTVLLLCTGLFLRSLQAAQGLDLGLGNRNLLLLAFDPSLDQRTEAQSRELLRDILTRARAVPGVDSATLTTGVPLTLIIDNSSFVDEGRQADRTRRVRTDIYSIAPQYFGTMGIPFIAGRDFGAETERVAIVNDAFARAVLPGVDSAIGRVVVGDGKRLRIVGVVGTAKSRTIGEAPRPVLFLPVLTEYTAAQRSAVTLVVKTREAAAAYAGPVRDAIRRADPMLAVYDVRTMERHLENARLVPRLAGTLSTVAGLVGLAIATVGVYGVISFAVARRRREMGIRLAVGARPREIVAMVLRQGLAMTAVGTGLGVAAGIVLTRLVASLLYGVEPRDTATFVAVPAFLLVIALLACLLPARSAARTDPVNVLRSE
jgi:predicted permease